MAVIASAKDTLLVVTIQTGLTPEGLFRQGAHCNVGHGILSGSESA